MSRLLVLLGLILAGVLSANVGRAQQPTAPVDGEKGEVSVANEDGAKDSQGEDAIPPDPTEEELAEYEAEVKKRTESFVAERKKFEDSLVEQQSLYIRYVNQQDSSKAALDRYRKQRSATRQAMDSTYLAALDLIRIASHDEAAQYVATVAENRLASSIYSQSTAEGCARLIDGGAKFLFLFRAGARSAATSGEFEVARRIYGALSEEREEFEDLDRKLNFSLDELEERFKVEREIRKREAEADNLPRVKLETSQGDVVLELYINEAPSTVANFITLVEQGFYDGLDFHQVVGDLLALTGDPTGLGSGGSGKFLVDEHDREDARDGFRGSLVMANHPIPGSSGFLANSSSSQFAILYIPLLHLTDTQTVFGRVIEGMDSICRLRRVNDKEGEKKEGKIQIPPDYIIRATVIRRPDELPEIKYFDPSSLRRPGLPATTAAPAPQETVSQETASRDTAATETQAPGDDAGEAESTD